MKKTYFVMTAMLAISMLLGACSTQAIPTTTPTFGGTATLELPTDAGTGTPMDETTTPSMDETGTPGMDETTTPSMDETGTPGMGDTTGTPAATRAPLISVTINVKQSDTLGSYLVDDQGDTLYLSTKDSMNTSNCTGDCADEWPPLLLTTKLGAMAGSGVDMSKLGVTVRADGGIQVTYNGWPLYYFDEDENPGDVKGQGQDNFFVVSPSGDQINK